MALKSGMGTFVQLENLMMTYLPWLEMEDEKSDENDNPYIVATTVNFSMKIFISIYNLQKKRFFINCINEESTLIT